MKYLNRLLVIILLLAVWLGFGLPALISHRSYELPLVGAAVTLAAVYFATRSLIKSYQKENNNEDTK